MWWCEDYLNRKTAHFRLTSVAQKRCMLKLTILLETPTVAFFTASRNGFTYHYLQPFLYLQLLLFFSSKLVLGMLIALVIIAVSRFPLVRPLTAVCLLQGRACSWRVRSVTLDWRRQIQEMWRDLCPGCHAMHADR